MSCDLTSSISVPFTNPVSRPPNAGLLNDLVFTPTAADVPQSMAPRGQETTLPNCAPAPLTRTIALTELVPQPHRHLKAEVIIEEIPIKSPDEARYPAILRHEPHVSLQVNKTASTPSSAKSAAKTSSRTRSTVGTPTGAEKEGAKAEERYPRFVLTGDWSYSPRSQARRSTMAPRKLEPDVIAAKSPASVQEKKKKKNRVLPAPSGASSSPSLSTIASSNQEQFSRSGDLYFRQDSHKASFMSQASASCPSISDASQISLEEDDDDDDASSLAPSEIIDDTTLFCFMRNINNTLVELGTHYMDCVAQLRAFSELVRLRKAALRDNSHLDYILMQQQALSFQEEDSTTSSDSESESRPAVSSAFGMRHTTDFTIPKVVSLHRRWDGPTHSQE